MAARAQAAPMQHTSRLLRLRDVESKTGLSHSTIYRWMDGDMFPKPVKIGLGSVRWLEEDLDQWILARKAAGVQ